MFPISLSLRNLKLRLERYQDQIPIFSSLNSPTLDSRSNKMTERTFATESDLSQRVTDIYNIHTFICGEGGWYW